jgi:hypothetical protein
MNTVNPNTTSASANNPADTKQILLKDIGANSEQELGALKSKDELVTQVVAKYSIDKAQGWFVPPIVVPAGLALLLGAVMLYRQFIGV